MLRAQRGQLINIILRSPFNVLHSVLVGERSEPLSDKLGGEICIALVCIYLYLFYTSYSYYSISRYAYRGISAHIPRRDLVIFCVLRSH